MLEAILDGGKTPEEIADLACGTLRKKIPTITRAVSGGFTASTTTVLKHLLRLHDAVAKDIAHVDAESARLLAPSSSDIALLDQIPGLDAEAAAAILAETTSDMSVFPSADSLAAWAGLSPGSEQSAGKSKAAPVRKGNKYLRTMLVQCAWTAVRTKGTFWKRKFAQLARFGPKKAVVAIARKMLVAIYYILRDRVPYKEPDSIPPPPHRRKELIKRFTAQLEALGVRVTLDLQPGPAVS
jgi:transposase